MPEPNEPTTSRLQPKEVCTLRIVFPVESDEIALSAKKHIAEYLRIIPEAQIYFSIMPIPRQSPNYREPQIR